MVLVRQMTLAATGFERHSKVTRRATFLAEMDRVVPWPELCALIQPVYPKAGNGRPPIGLERMLRVYFLQQWFNLSDPGVEEALYESLSIRRFADIDLGRKLFEQVHRRSPPARSSTCRRRPFESTTSAWTSRPLGAHRRASPSPSAASPPPR